MASTRPAANITTPATKTSYRVFENLSMKLHDDGIDEGTLGELAEKTGGRYFHAKEIGSLELKLKDITTGMQEMEIRESFVIPNRAGGLARDVVIIPVLKGTAGDVIDPDVVGPGSVTGALQSVFPPRLVDGPGGPADVPGHAGCLGIVLALPAGLSRLKRGSRPAAAGDDFGTGSFNGEPGA